ncbi:mediator of RNA polymerase II transcription subunit 15a-like isoform X2 [Benincasa hispida]|uniref:mediator of RNA polymerase II transcription subunit 15a-like isoform X2 n=2 Tax=Benincasa hispida TaxID=102211 RepID=UPI001901B183|nr:mediator of RNA polymerase II transcription subunit 15a-like isoform X2 [Benincasa hispida]
MMLNEQWSAHHADGMNMKAISELAREHEMELFSMAKSKDDYLNAGTRKMNRRENHHGSSSTQVAVPNPQYHQSAEPNSLLRQHIQPTTQLHRQNLNVGQTHQQFGMHNQRHVSPQNTLNSQFQRRDFGIHPSPEMFTQHPNLVNLQPNENLTTQVKEEVNGEGFQASKSSHQHHTAIEQYKQQQSMGASAVPEEIPTSEDWHDVAFAEMERLKKTYLPLLEKACELSLQVVQAEQIQQQKHDPLRGMMKFLQLPRDKIILTYDKEKFYRCLQTIEKVGKAIKSKFNLGNKQQPLHGGQPGPGGSRLNPVQQSNSVKLHRQPVIRATTGFPDGTSPIASPEKGSVRSETDCIQINLLQNRQHFENIESEFRSQWLQPKQNATGNIPAIYRSGMSLNHYCSNVSPQIHEASQLSQFAERPLPTNPCGSSLHGRASPAPSSSIVRLDKSSPNVSYLSSSNFQFPQNCNPLEFLHPKAEIEVQSQKIRSSSAMTSPFATPTSLGSNGQLPTATQAHNRLLKAVESLSNEALTIAVSGISSVGYSDDAMIDPWCHAKVTDVRLQDGSGSSNNMKRKINATALNNIPSPCSDITGSEPTVTSRRKKLKKLSDYSLLEELRNINKQFVETVLELDLDESLNRKLANAGTVLRCSYSAATECKNSEACPVKLPVLSVKLLVPLDYPEDYPVFLSKFNTNSGNVDKEFRDLSNEATLMLRAFLRTAPDCLSLLEYARVWDECARSVVSEYAQRAGGGCFSTQYGTWEDTVAVAQSPFILN